MTKTGSLWLKARPGIFALLLLVYFMTYYPGSHGGFIYDDYPNIVSNQDIMVTSLEGADLLRAAFSSFSGFLQRPVSMLSFAINHYFSGFDPYYYKITNILIHLLNGLLAGLLACLILGVIRRKSVNNNGNIQYIALAVAAIWLLHPINLTSVLYVVQRMNELAALFTFMGLCFYISGRTGLMESRKGWVKIGVALFLCGPLAAFSKENGALLYLYIFLVEILFFTRSGLNGLNRSLLYGLFGLFIVLPALVVPGYLSIHPEFIMDGYQQRPFTLMERLLTEARVLWFYVYLITIPNIQRMSLHYDSIGISSGLFEPVSTALAILGWLAVIIFSIKYRKKYPLASFGLLFFLAGHSMESTAIPLIIAFEHRNYVPAFGIILFLASAGLSQTLSPKTLRIRQVFVVLLIVILAFSTNIRARQWGNAGLLRFYELQHNPNSAAVNYEAGRFYAEMLETGMDYVGDSDLVYNKAEHYFNRVINIQPYNIEALVGLLILEISNKNYVDYNLFSRLYDVLENQQINSTGIAAINALLTCNRDGECAFPESAIESAIDSIEKNNSLYGRNAELMYSNISRYYLSVDMDKAYTMAEKGLALNPDSMDMRLYFAALLIDMGRADEAKTEIEELRKSDKLGIYDFSIRKLEKAMQAD